MCGIVGLWDACGQYCNSGEITAMSEALVHRGPDQGGAWLDRDVGLALGHRRLSILDLSDAGRQPMVSPSGRYVAVFNGEIYNHLALREELGRAHGEIPWKGHSDTETLLAAFDHWGISGTLVKSSGMFAIGVWDRECRELSLIRDRVGEKPLYYGWNKGVLLFSSELKGIKAFSGFESQVNRVAVAEYLRYGYVPAPLTIYEAFNKQLPGTILTFSPDKHAPEEHVWWSAQDIMRSAQSAPFEGGERAAVERLEILLGDSVAQQMVADVPLGAFLSGGVDSSAVVALMQSRSSKAVKTFSIGSSDARYDESHFAKAVARHLGTDHTEMIVSPEDVLEVIPALSTVYDEPFADASQIPTLLVASLARKDVIVSLSGDGGDELFAGYNRYQITNAMWTKLARLPRWGRRVASKLLLRVPPAQWDAMALSLMRVLPQLAHWDRLGDKLHKGAKVLASRTIADVYQGVLSSVADPSDLVLGAKDGQPALRWHDAFELGRDPIEAMMLADILGYLPDSVLCKLDRAAMSVSLETRVPLLDPALISFSASLPLDLKLRDGTSKWVLRQVLYQYVPRELIERPKKGFALPIDSWLRTGLKAWADGLLAPARISADGYFDADFVSSLWSDHVAETKNNAEILWSILMFNAWLDHESG